MNLSDEQRQAIYHELLAGSQNGKLKRGDLSRVARKFRVNRSTVLRISNRAERSLSEGRVVANVRSRIRRNFGRKKINRNIVRETIRSTPYVKRRTIRALVESIHLPKSTVHDLKREKLYLRNSNFLKPALSAENRQQRVDFALSFLSEKPRTGEMTFCSMHNYVHLDEKWFYITKERENYYILPEETPPHRSTKSKRYISKIMFLCAVSRPQYDFKAKRFFDGK